uniref:Integrase catalytic domain-containing protein n=1 Tax=Trichogramma kaykai TaxID=54128 RepID=A0ABD2WUZ7_9HYME
MANCRKRQAAEDKKDSKSSDNNDSGYKNGAAKATFLATGLTVNSDSISADSWIADSGATNHMTANKQHFSAFKPFSSPISVEVANGDKMLAYGCGSVDIELSVKDEIISAKLSDLWYVPNLGHQLFSVPQAIMHGNKVAFDADGVTVKYNDKVVATGVLIGSTYIMNMNVCTSRNSVQANLSNTEDVLQGRHERLGHQDKRHVRNVLSKHGVAIKFEDTRSFCDGCVMGKSYRKPFSPRQERAQKVGELIHSDVNGPMSMNSIHGFKYYVVFKDDFSRYTRIFFMKEKSEVANYLNTFLNECLTAGHKVKRFRSDGGGEFHCARVREMLNNQGIEINLTCPYTPECC